MRPGLGSFLYGLVCAFVLAGCGLVYDFDPPDDAGRGLRREDAGRVRRTEDGGGRPDSSGAPSDAGMISDGTVVFPGADAANDASSEDASGCLGRTNGTSCDDGYECTTVDRCHDGLCAGVEPCNLVVAVAASADDALQDPPRLMTRVLVAYEWASLYTNEHYAGMRFVLDVPPGARITAAFVEVYLDSDYESYTQTRIYGEAADDAAPFEPVPGSISARPGTAAYVDWLEGRLNVAGEVESPNLASILQEIVDRAGWRSGQHVVLIWNHLVPPPMSTMTLFEWRQWDFEEGSYAPKLDVTYRPPPR